MNARLLAAACTATLVAITLGAPLAQAGDGVLHFEFTGMKSDAGSIRCGLYNTAGDFLGRSFREASGAIKGGRASCDFANVPAGTYAVGAWHDANDNGKLDTNFLGIPNEGVACSNNAKGFAGPPKWKDASFVYTSGPLTQSLRVRY